MAYKLRQSQKLRTLQKATLIFGGSSILALVVYFSIVMNQANVTDSIAGNRDLMANDPVNNGEILLGYSWDETNVLKADVGTDAFQVSQNAEVTSGGTDSTSGLSAGNVLKGIDMTFKPVNGLNADGIDFSVDFRSMEESGSFFSRGNTFNFGMEKGKLSIKYKLTSPNGKSYMVDELTSYEIPVDMTYRNYRFIYNPATGRGEVMVNRATVWMNQGVAQSRMTWKTDEPLVFGKDMNGSGKAMAIFDNMLVRSMGSANVSPMQLLSFSAELQGKDIMINWFTGKEAGTEFFKIEKSTDTKNYTEIGRVKAAGTSETLKAYALLDKDPVLGITYYRLGLTNSSAHSVWVPVIAFRIKPEMLTPIPSANTTVNQSGTN